MTEPATGFAHAAISTMFNPPPPSPTTIAPSPTASPLTQHHRDPPVGVIVGATVGGVAGLALVLCLILWPLHKRRLRQRQGQSPASNVPPTAPMSEYPDFKVGLTDVKTEDPGTASPMDEDIKQKSETGFNELSPDSAVHELAAEYPFCELSSGRPSVRRARSRSTAGRQQTFEICPGSPDTRRDSVP